MLCNFKLRKEIVEDISVRVVFLVLIVFLSKYILKGKEKYENK